MNYVFCPTCGSVQEAKVKSKLIGSGSKIVCRSCGKYVKAASVVQKCIECENVLFHSPNDCSVVLPCVEGHKAAAEQKQKEDSIHYSMREIQCQHCPSIALRIEDGKYQTCPNCHQEPSEVYIQEQWRKLTNQEPALIQWDDPSGQKLLHVDQRFGNIPPFSVLLVREDQHVVYESDGNRTILKKGCYPLFKENRSLEEKLILLNTADEANTLTLGLGTRIIFFSEKRYEFDCRIPFRFGTEEWEAEIAVRISLNTGAENAKNLMDFRMDLTDDQKATDTLERLVVERVKDKIIMHLLSKEGDEALMEATTEGAVKRWIVAQIEEIRHDVTIDVSTELTGRYGISLPDPILIAAANTNVWHVRNYINVECSYLPPDANAVPCGHVNHIPVADFQMRRAFICEECGKRLIWCKTCRAYVTTSRATNICDRGRHGVY